MAHVSVFAVATRDEIPNKKRDAALKIATLHFSLKNDTQEGKATLTGASFYSSQAVCPLDDVFRLDRHVSNALAGCRKDRVGNRRSDRRDCRLA